MANVTSPQVFYLDWGQDFVLTSNGSLQMATGWDYIRQMLVRGLLTNPTNILPDGTPIPADDIFNPTYGVGAGSYVDQNITASIEGQLTQRVTTLATTIPGINPNITPSVTFKKPAPHELQMTVGLKLSNGQPGTVTLSIAL